MPLIHMVLADHDYEYVNHLAQWFIENKPHQFQISAFTEKETFIKFLSESKNEVDIILAEENFLIDNLDLNDKLIILGQAVKLFEHKSIEKYQAAPFICSDILSAISSKQNEVSKWYMPGKSDLVVCYSPNAKVKSIFSLLLSMISPNYVYINFESFPLYTINEDLQAYNKNLSDVLYNIKTEKGNPIISLESAVITSNNQISFVAPIDNPRDLWELSDKETDTLINALKSWGHFSKVIADLECNTSPMSIKLLEAASYIIIPFDNTQVYQVPRLNSMLHSVSSLNTDKIRWVLCGNSEGKSEDLNNYFEFPWINDSVLPFSDFPLDVYRKEKLEELFSY